MKQALILLFMVGALAFGCADYDTETTDTGTETEAADTNGDEQTELSPEELAELSNQISQNPENAQQILSEHGLTEEEFEEQIRAVAADPELSDEYAQTFRKSETGA